MAYNRKDFLKISGMSALALATGRSDACSTSTQSPIPSLIKPQRISFNSTLGLVAPASPIYEESVFDRMIETLKSFGFSLKLGKHVRDRRGYLAGTDQDRAADLMQMFEDPDVDAIMCIRGGWGCNRILPLLNYDLIRANPKPLIGFSDITSLHMAIQKKSGLVTFHGPVGKSDWTPFTVRSFEQVLIQAEPCTYSLPESELHKAFVIQQGSAEGVLLGGNLSVLASMLGSDYLPSFKGAILFLEDVGEDPYRVDRMLTQLKLNGILDELNGFIFGQCTNCTAGTNSLTLRQVFDDHIKPLGIPAFYGAMISHEENNATIPLGLPSRLTSEDLSFRITESGVA